MTAPPQGYRTMALMGQGTFSDTAGPFFERIAPDALSPQTAVWIAMPVTGRHLNLGGICHGGALLAFADELLGAAVDHVLQEHWLVTVDLGVQFLQAAPPGTLIEGRGEVVRKGGLLAFAEGRFTVAGRLIATARGVFRHGPRKPR